MTHDAHYLSLERNSGRYAGGKTQAAHMHRDQQTEEKKHPEGNGNARFPVRVVNIASEHGLRCH
jgi:hypothetical protein